MACKRKGQNDFKDLEDLTDLEDLKDLDDLDQIDQLDKLNDSDSFSSSESSSDESSAKTNKKKTYHKQFSEKYRFGNRRILSATSANEMSDKKFKKLFHMPKDCFEFILSHVESKYPRQGLSVNGKSLCPRERLLIYFYCVSGDVRSQHAAFAFDCSANVIKESIRESIIVLFEEIVPKFIRVPNREEGLKEARLFHILSKFPAIIWGIIDGSHILVSFF